MKDKLKHVVIYGATAGLFALKAAGCGDTIINNYFTETDSFQGEDISLDSRIMADQGRSDSIKMDSYVSPDAGIQTDAQSTDQGYDALSPDTGAGTDLEILTDGIVTDSQSSDLSSDLTPDLYSADSLVSDSGVYDTSAADTGFSPDNSSLPDAAGSCLNLGQVPGCLGNYQTLVSAGAEVTQAQQLGYQNVTMDETNFSKGVVSGNPCTLPKQFPGTCLDYIQNQVAGQSLVKLDIEGNVTVKGSLQERITALELLAGGKLSGTDCTITGIDPDTATHTCN